MNVTLLYFDDCPNWRQTDTLLDGLRVEYGFSLDRREVRTPEEAARLGFRGSPTVLIDGADPFADPEAPVGLSCRIYQGPEGLTGSPAEAMLRAVLEGRPSRSSNSLPRT